MNYLNSELGSIPDAVEFMPLNNTTHMEFGDVLTHSSLTLGYEFYDFYNNMVEREVNAIMDYKAKVSFEIYDVPGLAATVYSVISLLFSFITLYLIKQSESEQVSQGKLIVAAIISIATGILSVIYGLRPSAQPGDNFVGKLCSVLGIISVVLAIASLWVVI